jgi:hypothetical protein
VVGIQYVKLKLSNIINSSNTRQDIGRND